MSEHPQQSQSSLLRPDLQIIADYVAEGSKVLEIGCSDGELLAWLRDEKQADVRGLELDQARVNLTLARGLAVIEGNAETDLHYYPPQSHDVAILSRTLQAMHDPVAILHQLLRVGKQVVVSIPNFGYWRNRSHLALKGRMPVTQTLRYEWYNTPNIHFCTLRDFALLCDEQQIDIRSIVALGSCGRPLRNQSLGWANLFAEQAIFMLEKKKKEGAAQ